MNKIVNINLGGYPFTIDDDAYERLNRYIDRIEDHFSQSEGCDEIISDIESRMAELFNEKLEGRSIINMKVLDDVIKTMGTPEDFGAEEDMDHYGESQRTEEKYSGDRGFKPGKRLYRDMDEKVIAGVCSGLAAYLGISDPVWVRVGVILIALISGGSLIIPYLILWAVVPKAITAGDRLAMRGEKININNIAKTIEDEFSNISETISDLGQEFRSKKKDNIVSKSGSFITKPFKLVFRFIGSVFSFLFRLIKKIVKPILGLVLILLGLGFILLWVGLIVFGIFYTPFISYLYDFSLFGYLHVISGLITVGLPLLGLVLGVIKVFGPYMINKKARTNLALVWLGSFMTFISLTVYLAMGFQTSAHSTAMHEIPHDPSQPIQLNWSYGGLKNKWLSLDEAVYHDGKIIMDNVAVHVEPSDTDKLILKVKKSSQGRSQAQADKFVKNLSAEWTNENNVITITDASQLAKKDLYRGQELEYTLYVPVGSHFVWDRSKYYWPRVKNALGDHYYQKDDNKNWLMGSKGVYHPEDYEILTNGKLMNTKPFKKLNIDFRNDIELKYGKNHEIRFYGTNAQFDKLDLVQTENETFVKGNLSAYSRGGSRMVVTTPDISDLVIKSARSVHIIGNEKSVENMKLELVNVDEMNTEVLTNELTIKGKNVDRITLKGQAEVLDINLRGVKIEATHFPVKIAKLRGSYYTRDCFFTVSDTLYSDNQSRMDQLNINGSPAMIFLEK